ncbi:MAG: hypothetical protein HY827_10290 [Actinobacteria bacterium]|nr:hypothetical protein [Actinomycetota bacterium]
MKPPDGLGNAGKKLWSAMHADLPDGWEFSKRELVQLEMAAHQADDLARLETEIRKGTTRKGSMGQTALNGAIQEARQARAAVDRLIGRLAIPDESGTPRTTASEIGRKAARARWGNDGAA